MAETTSRTNGGWTDVAARYASWLASGRFWFNFLALLGSVASIASIVLVLTLSPEDNDAQALWRWVMLASILASSLLFFCWGLYLFYGARQRSRYAEAYFYVHAAVHHLRDQLAVIENTDLTGPSLRTHSKETVEVTLDAISKAFSVITGGSCGACVKSSENRRC